MEKLKTEQTRSSSNSSNNNNNNNNNNNKVIISVFLFITAVSNIFYNIVIIHLHLCRKLHQITYKISWIEALRNTRSQCGNDIKRQTEHEYKHWSIKLCRSRISFGNNNNNNNLSRAR